MPVVKAVKGRLYVYSVKKINGKNVWKYLGPKGSFKASCGLLHAKAEEAEATQKKFEQVKMIELMQQQEDEISELCECVRYITHNYLKDVGYYQHARGEWRKSKRGSHDRKK